MDITTGLYVIMRLSLMKDKARMGENMAVKYYI